MDITPHLTSRATIKRNQAVKTDRRAWRDEFIDHKTDVACRISQPRPQNQLVGFQDVSELVSTILFEPDEDVNEHDRLEVTGGTPAQWVGTEWDLRGVVWPSVSAYTRATGSIIRTAAD